jgi:hypothetical protein
MVEAYRQRARSAIQETLTADQECDGTTSRCPAPVSAERKEDPSTGWPRYFLRLAVIFSGPLLQPATL